MRACSRANMGSYMQKMQSSFKESPFKGGLSRFVSKCAHHKKAPVHVRQGPVSYRSLAPVERHRVVPFRTAQYQPLIRVSVRSHPGPVLLSRRRERKPTGRQPSFLHTISHRPPGARVPKEGADYASLPSMRATSPDSIAGCR